MLGRSYLVLATLREAALAPPPGPRYRRAEGLAIEAFHRRDPGEKMSDVMSIRRDGARSCGRVGR